jgi:methylenetetrahydrofolate dehydrogenase (NADP+)/methenyltetrahydrofolate cyclohydrolase
MYTTLSGKEPADEVLEDARTRVKALGRQPVLAIVVVGDSKPSQIYVSNKIKTAESVGVKTEVHRLPQNVEQDELIRLIEKLNKDNSIDGFIVQLPLPQHINTYQVIEAIDPKKDVDGFHPANMGRVFINQIDEDTFLPATPAGIIKMLDYYGISPEGKNAVVIGRSNIVGKPVAMLLLHRNATVTICHSKTRNLYEHTKNADILVVAAGSPRLVTADMVKEGAYVVDVGTTRIGEKLVGDVDFEHVIKKAHCSPVPGGVGPLTVAMLISNTVKAAERKNK